MITKEKLLIRYNRFLRNFFYHLIFWELALMFFVFITEDNQLFTFYSKAFQIESIYLVVSVIVLFTSIIFSLIDFVFSDRLMRLFPVRLMVFLKSLLYFITALILANAVTKETLGDLISRDFKSVINDIPMTDIHVLRFLVYFYISCILNSFVKGMVKKIGRGNFRSWILGMLNKPREEERIFMFLDLKSSTTIAEKLEHKKFSHLVQDVFNDMAVVDNYNGEIYQYLGDGAIISWSVKGGVKRANFLHAYFAFTSVLRKRDRYYQRKYELTPRFKAGVHVGKVMVLQVGQIRRDISYNGDSINTAARIEAQCNEFKQNFLISGDLYDLITEPKEFTFKHMGNIKLKGKKKAVDIYSVKEKSRSRQKKK